MLTRAPHSAEDLAQAACLRALERTAQFNADSHLDRWVFKIAQRIWLNELRAGAVRRGGGLVPLEEIDLVDQAADTEMNILVRQVLMAVSELAEAQASAIILVYVEGFSYKEAAEIMEIPIGTVMSRLSAGRIRIAAKLNGGRMDAP